MKNHPIIRTIYLYLFALVGLIMVVIGAGRLVDLGLRTWVFTEADKQYYPAEVRAPEEKGATTTVETVDYAKADKQRDLAGALAQIIVGLPLYAYHWSIIKRDKKEV